MNENLAQAVARVAAIPKPRMTSEQFERLCSGIESDKADAFWAGYGQSQAEAAEAAEAAKAMKAAKKQEWELLGVVALAALLVLAWFACFVWVLWTITT